MSDEGGTRGVQNTVAQAVDLVEGMVDNAVFYDEDIYRWELEAVFGRTWQFVGHESMIPAPGDFVSTFMGEDSVILSRGVDGSIHVLLNKCRHRGNRVCFFDRGNSESFNCSYHGWSYELDGTLRHVPRGKELYGSEQRDPLSGGLVHPPRVETFGGLIFACWTSDVVPLVDYLGEAAWWLETYVVNAGFGGLEFVPGVQRYTVPINWKLLAENFAGDEYHFAYTHASFLNLAAQGPLTDKKPIGVREGAYSLATNYLVGPPHGFLEVSFGDASYEADLAGARVLGDEAVEWVARRWDTVAKSVPGNKSGPYAFHVGNIFPNLSLIGIGSALYAAGFMQWFPRGPHSTEVYEWCAVERDAPEIVKRHAVNTLLHRQAAAGLVGPDDHENFERITANLKSSRTRSISFDYSMGVKGRPFPMPDAWPGNDAGFGQLIPKISEINQRDLYRYWQALMLEDQMVQS